MNTIIWNYSFQSIVNESENHCRKQQKTYATLFKQQTTFIC